MAVVGRGVHFELTLLSPSVQEYNSQPPQSIQADAVTCYYSAPHESDKVHEDIMKNNKNSTGNKNRPLALQGFRPL